MRFPIPDRFPIKSVGFVAILVICGQQLEATDLTFSMLSGAFILLFGLAYNAGGGLFFPAGAWIFFNGMLTAIVGLVYKIILGEPGQTHLLNPNKTMLVYCAGMATVGLVAAVSHRMRRGRPLLAGMTANATMKRAAIGCLLIGAAVQVNSYSDFTSSGSLVSAIRQLNQLPRMAMILAVTYEIIHSKGKRSTNWIVWSAGLLIFFYGLINFSKEGIFTPVATWLFPAIALRFDFSKKQLAGCLVLIFLMVHYLVPFSQFGRRSRDENNNQYVQFIVALGYLEHIGDTRLQFLDSLRDSEEEDIPHFFDKPQGFFDREQMLAIDDALIDTTDHGHVYGLQPSYDNLANVIPRFLWKDKPVFMAGNGYGRELGVIGPDDTTTGISFSPVTDAYHQATWFGVFFVLPLVTFCYFFFTESLTGSARESPWALLPIAISSHTAPEAALSGTWYEATWGILVLFFVVFLCRTVLPFLTTFILGAVRTRLPPPIDFKPASPGPGP